MIKVSARALEPLRKRGLNLGEVLRVASEKYSGRGGGHDVAAGAQIPIKDIEPFIKLVDHLVKKQLEEAQPGSSDQAFLQKREGGRSRGKGRFSGQRRSSAGPLRQNSKEKIQSFHNSRVPNKTADLHSHHRRPSILRLRLRKSFFSRKKVQDAPKQLGALSFALSSVA